VIDLLAVRSAESFAEWLGSHPEVELITRDRSSLYAEGGRQGARAAVQITDRYHLVTNLGEAVERDIQQLQIEARADVRRQFELPGYFGPSPSTTNQSLVGPVQLLKSGPVNATKGTITVPLYLGHMKNGKNVWYILTDVDDADVAASLGLNFSAKMTFMANAARTANLDQNGDLVFDKRDR
jgi:hypothetical protein